MALGRGAEERGSFSWYFSFKRKKLKKWHIRLISTLWKVIQFWGLTFFSGLGGKGGRSCVRTLTSRVDIYALTSMADTYLCTQQQRGYQCTHHQGGYLTWAGTYALVARAYTCAITNRAEANAFTSRVDTQVLTTKVDHDVLSEKSFRIAYRYWNILWIILSLKSY